MYDGCMDFVLMDGCVCVTKASQCLARAMPSCIVLLDNTHTLVDGSHVKA